MSEESATPESDRRGPATQLTHLLEVSAAMLASSDLAEQLRLVASAIVEVCGYRRSVITLIDEEWHVRLRTHAGLTESEAKALEESPAVSPEVRRRILNERYRVGNSYFVAHGSRLGEELSDVGIATERPATEFVDWHPNDLLFVPLQGKDERILGTISVDDPVDGRRPTPRSLQILELFAREAAFAIEQSQLLLDLRRTEEYLENVVKNSRDAIVTTDPKGSVAIWNDGAQRMLGYTSEEILGESVLRLYASPKEAQQIMRRLMSGADGDAGTLDELETVLVSKTGESIPVSLSASALYDPNGEFLGTAGISRDLRPWKRLEQELVAAEKASTLSEVAASLCHEINNFLEEILSAGQVSLLTLDRSDIREMYEKSGKSGALDKEVERLTVISREALKIAGLTNQLQSIARGGTYETEEYVDDIKMMNVHATEPVAGGGRILIADDREYIREFLKDFLVLEGFEVDVAVDGQEALDMVRGHHYDLVLSDIKMPNKNGYEVFEGVRAMDPMTKVILMTAYGYDPSHSIVKASQEGLSAVLYKPFQMARVRDAIVKALAANGNGHGGTPEPSA
ncbi:MAG: hypothetical protein DHS20C21_02230 [Gemmatimonadota bacterium]|nr:MAG: hypothetical protein DHS20C21_02230 [Gemmatimonadota bacterium]